MGWNRATKTACIFKTNKKNSNKEWKNERGLLSHLWVGQEGMKSQATYNKHLCLGLCLFWLLFWGDKHLSLVCSLWILPRNFWTLLILNFCHEYSEYVQPKSHFNSAWIAGLWWASFTEDGFTMVQQQDFKRLLNRNEFVFASFHLRLE